MIERERGEPSPPPVEALGGRAMNGAIILAAAQGIRFAAQLVSTVILARLLSPHDFGVFAMIMPLVGFVMLFQDVGLSQAVIAIRDIGHGEESTIFYINLALSLMLAALFVAGAPELAWFYGTREVVAPTMVLAGTIALSGLASLQYGFLVRDLRFTAIALVDIAGTLAGIGTAIAVAMVRPSAWALVASVVANMLTGLAFGWIATGWRPGRPAPLARVAHLMRFGRGVIGANVADYVTRNADNVLIAHYLGPVPLGYYDRGYKLLLFPLQQIVSPLGRIVIPILSRLVDEPDRYRAAYFRPLDQILLVALPGMAVALVMADPLISFVMGERWRPVVPIFQWLGLVGLHLPLSQTLSWLLTSQGRTRELARIAIVQAATSVAGFAAGIPFGVIGIAAIFALSDLFVRLPLMIWYTGRAGPVSGAAIVARTAPHALAAGCAAVAVHLLMRALVLPELPMLILGTLLGYAMAWSVVAAFPTQRRAFAELLTLARRLPVVGRLA